MNVLTDATQTRRVDVGLPWMKQIRVSDDLYAWLDGHKPADETWRDFAVGSMVIVSLLQHILGRQLQNCIRQMVRLVGVPTDIRHLEQLVVSPPVNGTGRHV